MEQTIKELLEKNPYLQGRSLKEALEAYSHISLTEEEEIEAIISAKQKKEERLKRGEYELKVEENRKALTGSQWSYMQTRSFMQYRAGQLFEGFALDQYNEVVFELLCCYFSNDPGFMAIADGLNVKGASLDKGIMLAGNFGVGKTWLMKLFGRNQRQVFHIHNAKDIANEFEVDGESAVEMYVKKYKNAINDSKSFFQPFAGLCIDDMGTEDIKNHFGNKKNVIGDLIEQRYSQGNSGVLLHAATNLTAQQVSEFYGGRVASRLREIVNFIEVPGKDRRK